MAKKKRMPSKAERMDRVSKGYEAERRRGKFKGTKTEKYAKKSSKPRGVY